MKSFSPRYLCGVGQRPRRQRLRQRWRVADQDRRLVDRLSVHDRRRRGLPARQSGHERDRRIDRHGRGHQIVLLGVGEHPDMVNASRQMKAGEYADCAKAGAKQVIEVPIGIDGLTFIEGIDGPGLNLTVADLYNALAANLFGKPNTATT